MAAIDEVNSKIVGSVSGILTSSSFISGVGWFIFALLIIGASGYGAWVYYERKKFSRKITAFEIVGSNFSPILRDRAKVVKLGSGGFEVLYLKKLKTWKLAYGGRVGKDTYYFFIMPDGYWYNGMMSADIKTIDKNGGLIPIVTTNPTMRAQYTALEKQIDSLHGDKKTFWAQYGNWVLSIAFVLIIGVLAWLIYKEMAPLMGQFTSLTAKMTELTEQMTKLAANIDRSSGGGLVPA